MRVPALSRFRSSLFVLGLLLAASGGASACPAVGGADGGMPSLLPALAEIAAADPAALPAPLLAQLASHLEAARRAGEIASPADPQPLCAIGATGDSTVVRAHGITSMAAIVQLFMELEPLYPRAGELWRGGLDWMVAHARPGNPGTKWIFMENDPTYGDTYAHPVVAWNALAFAEGWARTGDDCYLQMATGAMTWLESEKLALADLPNGAGLEGCAYVELDLWSTPHLYNIGSYGHAAIGRAALEVYRLTGDATARGIAECLAETYLSVAESDSAGGVKWGVFEPILPGYHFTSFCAGAAGIVEFLIEMAETFPGGWYEQHARDGLAWLTAIAEPDPTAAKQPAYKWPGRADAPSGYASIVGGGAAGVGRAFLSAHAAFGDPQYRRMAAGAGNWVLSQSQAAAGGVKWGDPNNEEPWWTNWCVGQIGIMNFLGHLYDATGDADYAAAFDAAHGWLEAQVVSPPPGGAVFPGIEGGPGNSTDYIWGFTGLANTHYEPASSLVGTQEHAPLYIGAMQYLDHLATPENGGLTWPLYVLLYQTSDAGGRGPASLARRRAHPNPSRDEVTIEFETPRPSGAELRIVDVTGRLVRRMPASAARDLASGGVAFRWDRRDDRGRQVPQGVYFASLADPHAAPAATVRLTVLR